MYKIKYNITEHIMMDNCVLLATISMIFQHEWCTAILHEGSWKFFKSDVFVLDRDDKVRWPPRSPDLTSLDFFLWGRIKERVYKDDISNITFEAIDCREIREMKKKRHHLTFCSDITNSSSKLMCAATRRTFSTILVIVHCIVVLQ